MSIFNDIPTFVAGSGKLSAALTRDIIDQDGRLLSRSPVAHATHTATSSDERHEAVRAAIAMLCDLDASLHDAPSAADCCATGAASASPDWEVSFFSAHTNDTDYFVLRRRTIDKPAGANAR